MTDSTMVDADAAWPNIDGICGLLEVGCRNTRILLFWTRCCTFLWEYFLLPRSINDARIPNGAILS